MEDMNKSNLKRQNSKTETDGEKMKIDYPKPSEAEELNK